MKDVRVAIILFQLAVASGPPQVPRVLCDPWTARDGREHGPGIPGPGTREATLDAVGSSVPTLLPFRLVLEMNGHGGEFTLFYLTKAHTQKYTHKEKRREGYCNSSTAHAAPVRPGVIPKG